MLLGLYYVNLSRFKLIRFIAYYSYNWYLWHPIFVIYITKQIGNTKIGLLIYLLVTFIIAMLATILIEERLLKKRKVVLDKLFKQKK
jgi:peptidoglycan/LPS O-acetylase OafA/YrhL